MSDPQMREFGSRVRRIQKSHRKGRGFEAAGAVGRSYYTKREKTKGRSLLRPTITVVLLFVTFKAAILTMDGRDVYLERLEQLKNGGTVSQGAAHLLAVDPFTELMSIWFQPILG
ncbi:MAG: hypothetical protein AAFQ66_22075 [Pseudomonadota bacterium]